MYCTNLFKVKINKKKFTKAEINCEVFKYIFVVKMYKIIKIRITKIYKKSKKHINQILQRHVVECRTFCRNLNKNYLIINDKRKYKVALDEAWVYPNVKVLCPILMAEIPILYSNNFHRVKSINAKPKIILRKVPMKIDTCIEPFQHSPYVSPMDYRAFGLLKRAISKRKPTTIDGL